jgi:hypothetical protein
MILSSNNDLKIANIRLIINPPSLKSKTTENLEFEKGNIEELYECMEFPPLESEEKNISKILE